MATTQTPKGTGASERFRTAVAVKRGDLTNPLDGATSKPGRVLNTRPHPKQGNQVRLSANTKGTDVVGRASALALAGKRRVAGAVENPDGSPNRAGSFKRKK